MVVRKEDGRFAKTGTLYTRPADHDPRALDDGALCFDDNCIPHEHEKQQNLFHYMLSEAACTLKGCRIGHLGYTGVPMEIREFNMMIKPVKKETTDPRERRVPNLRSTLRPLTTNGRGGYQTTKSIANPHHPRHFTTSWHECIHNGCISHEAARQAEEDGMPHVSQETHPDHGILDWTECATNNCAIHRDEKEEHELEIKKQNDGTGWALSEDETQRINAYVDDQVKNSNIRSGTPIPINKDVLSALEEGEITEEPEQMDESTETEEQHLSTPEESEYDSTDDECDDEFDANHVQFAAEANKPVIKLIKLIARYHKNAFPVQNGKTYLHPFHFDVMLKRIRGEFWNHRLVPVTYDARTFVQEQPPLGSDFTPSGYLAPDGTFFNSSMRNCVTKVKHLYKDMHMAQTTATYLMTESEFINDYTRCQSTIKSVQNTMAAMNKRMPVDWETQYSHALKMHGYPPQSSKNHGYAPHHEQSEN